MVVNDNSFAALDGHGNGHGAPQPSNLLGALAPAASHAVELAVLIAADLVATLRRVAYRAWVFHPRRRGT